MSATKPSTEVAEGRIEWAFYAGQNPEFSGYDALPYFTGRPELGWCLYSRGAGGCWNQRTLKEFAPSPGMEPKRVGGEWFWIVPTTALSLPEAQKHTTPSLAEHEKGCERCRAAIGWLDLCPDGYKLINPAAFPLVEQAKLVPPICPWCKVRSVVALQPGKDEKRFNVQCENEACLVLWGTASYDSAEEAIAASAINKSLVLDSCGNCRAPWPCGCPDPVKICGICGGDQYDCKCDERSYLEPEAQKCMGSAGLRVASEPAEPTSERSMKK